MNDKIENILVYMPDSLRWDHRHPFIGDDGVPIKTAAHSTYTFTSMPSMLTGYLPNHHGVYSQRHSLQFDPAEEGLFNIDSLNTYFKANQILAGHFHDAADKVWRHFDESHDVSHIDDLEPPFLYFKADSGGHAPYDNGKEYGSGWEFLYDTAQDSESSFRDYYKNSVQNSAGRLEQMLSELEERGLRESTLVIVTSDHGEHLWEYGGIVGHLHPATPELIHVPTILRHPRIDEAELPKFIHHVDLVPTIFQFLGVDDPYARDGRDFLADDYKPRPAINLTQYYPGKLSDYGEPSIYTQESVWDADGGHVFNRRSIPFRFAFFVVDQIIERKAIGGKWQGFHPNSLKHSLPLYLYSHLQHGTPSFNKDTAEELLSNMKSIEGATTELDQETEERLEDLGYI